MLDVGAGGAAHRVLGQSHTPAGCERVPFRRAGVCYGIKDGDIYTLIAFVSKCLYQTSGEL